MITYCLIIRFKIFVLGLVLNLVCHTSGYCNDTFEFSEQTIPELKLSVRENTVMYFEQLEERQKLCLYAKMKANLPYIAYNFDRAWRWVENPQPVNDFSMNCGTLPSMYILRDLYPSTKLMISYIQSSTKESEYDKEYEFDKNIIKADLANRRGQVLSWIYLTVPPVNLNEEDRKNLCDVARHQISVPLYFLDHNVPEMEPYYFKYSDKTLDETTAYAFSCPTLPQLFILCEDVGEEFKLVLIRSFIDNYEFELENTSPVSVRPLNAEERSKSKLVGSSWTQLEKEDRKNLCNIARKYYAVWLSPFVEDTLEVPEAGLYSFQYPQAVEELFSVALFCPKLPKMYLLLDEYNERTKIKITFAPNPADRHTYKVEVICRTGNFCSFCVVQNYLTMGPSQYSDDDDEEAERRRKFREHPFASLNKEDCWNLCFAAQKYLHSEPNRWIFRFTTKESIFAEHWLFLIPEFVRLPEVKRINYMGSTPTNEEDLVIQCSEWPHMYLHLGESDNVIEIMLDESELKL